MGGFRTATVLLVAVLAGCSTSGSAAVLGETCPSIADDAIAMTNEYIARAGPLFEDAPPPPDELGEGVRRRFQAAGCSQEEFADLMAQRVSQIRGDTEVAEFMRAGVIAAANPEDVEVEVVAPKVPSGKGPTAPPEMRRVERLMKKPPNFKIPAPQRPPPLPMPTMLPPD